MSCRSNHVIIDEVVVCFQRNMREAHAMYPFTGKRDKELFDKALAEVSVLSNFLHYHHKKHSTCITYGSIKLTGS